MGCMCNQCKINTQQMPYTYLLIVEFHIKRSVIPIFLANPPKWDSIHCNNIFLQVQQCTTMIVDKIIHSILELRQDKTALPFCITRLALIGQLEGCYWGFVIQGRQRGTQIGEKGGYPTKKRPLANHMTEPFFLMLYVL